MTSEVEEKQTEPSVLNNNEPPPEADTTAVAVPVPSAASASMALPSSRKRSSKPMVGSNNPLDAVTAAALTTATQNMSTSGFHGLASLLANSLQDPNTNSIIPNKEQVVVAAKKALADQPVWVHMSKQDMAPQFKVDSTRLALTGAFRGYRMARASHGVSNTGSYYFECIILPGPSATEILNSLPPNARLGPGLREQLQAAVDWEQKNATSTAAATAATSGSSSANPSDASATATTTTDPENTADATTASKKRKLDPTSTKNAIAGPPKVGGHVRLGWSMRTGDLQAPVGYDKWSYGIRDIGGSILHCSRRNDHWGGEGFGAKDVIGCAIYLNNDDDNSEEKEAQGGAAGTPEEENAAAAAPAGGTNNNKSHIRFFKNGNCMGQFVISKGKREGGEAFRVEQPGTYYPAVSCYMGGAVQVNFGPHWVCPPKRSRLPPGLANLQPMSSVSAAPPSAQDAVQACAATVKLFRKSDHQQALKDAVYAEAEIQNQVYSEFLQNHIAEIRQARLDRGLSVADLPAGPNEENKGSGELPLPKSEDRQEGTKKVEMDTTT